MAASIILMAANGCFTKKIFGCSNVKKTVVKEVCHLELEDIYLQVMKSICLILPNY